MLRDRIAFRTDHHTSGRAARTLALLQRSLAILIIAPAVIPIQPDALAQTSNSAEFARADRLDQRESLNIPSWAMNARWYHVDVPRFHNADPDNDPPGTRPWPVDQTWPPGSADRAGDKPHAVYFGGDLAGLLQRLAYFEALHVNTLYLSNVFQGQVVAAMPLDLQHVDDSVGETGGKGDVAAGTTTPVDPRFTASDKLFLRVIRQAHQKNLRVLVGLDVERIRNAHKEEGATGKMLMAVPKRWMDPDGDGDPSDGIDGWVVRKPGKLPRPFWKRWRRQIKAINDNALLVGAIEDDPAPWLEGDAFDVAINYEIARALRRFLSTDREAYSVTAFLDALASNCRRWPLERQLASPVPISGPSLGRALSALSSQRLGADQGASTSQPLGDLRSAATRWRLATMIQHVVPGVPLIYYGDEVGVLDTPQYGGRAPMPWLHRSQEKAASKNFRMDFAALTQFLHIHRELHEPLRRGEFRNVMADDKRGLLAFGRTYDGKELILLINFGNAKEEVHLRVGVPGQMITVIGPRLVPMTPSRGQWVEPLRAGASRRVVKSDGTIRFWINPNAVRLILVEP